MWKINSGNVQRLTKQRIAKLRFRIPTPSHTTPSPKTSKPPSGTPAARTSAPGAPTTRSHCKAKLRGLQFPRHPPPELVTAPADDNCTCWSSDSKSRNASLFSSSSHNVPNGFWSCTQYVLQIPIVFPNTFQRASHFYPIWFGKFCPSFIYVYY
jgi:hypothetical protein